MKTILEYRNHQIIVAMRNQCKNSASFSFTELTKKKLNI